MAQLAAFPLKALAALSLAGASALAHAAWPDRPISLVVGFTAGGSADTLARTIADLDGAGGVLRRHIAEALIYRRNTVGAEADFGRRVAARGDATFGLREHGIDQAVFTHD